MTQTIHPLASELLETLADRLDIPRSLYERAVARHKSLGEWLCRPESRIAVYDPHVSPQGSFRYGTVIRPLLEGEEYDLDNVTTLKIPKTAMTQKELKELYMGEIKSYAEAHNMLAPIEDKNRCCRLVYADEVDFHLDTLPCVPEDAAHFAALIQAGVSVELARRAVAITDRRHPDYERITAKLFSSNPRGFARWFESRARQVAERRIQKLVEGRLYASVDDVPPYEWKTPLQRSIQILKRHRDVMFRKNPELGPISMIITNLAAHAYTGESDLALALAEIVERMPNFIRPTRPRVPNPADLAEDYADKWRLDPPLEENFWLWHAQVKVDLPNLLGLFSGRDLVKEVATLFRIDLPQETAKRFANQGQGGTAPAVVRSAPVIYAPAAPKPWGSDV